MVTRRLALRCRNSRPIDGSPVSFPAYNLDRFDEARDRNTLAAHQRAGGKTAIVHDTVRRILGRDPRSFAEFAKDHANIFRGSPAEPSDPAPR
jgi:hypothetical protein